MRDHACPREPLWLVSEADDTIEDFMRDHPEVEGFAIRARVWLRRGKDGSAFGAGSVASALPYEPRESRCC
jgi:hypothetical protein